MMKNLWAEVQDQSHIYLLSLCPTPPFDGGVELPGFPAPTCSICLNCSNLLCKFRSCSSCASSAADDFYWFDMKQHIFLNLSLLSATDLSYITRGGGVGGLISVQPHPYRSISGGKDEKWDWALIQLKSLLAKDISEAPSVISVWLVC